MAKKPDLLSESLLLLELALIIGRMQDYDLESRCHEFLRILMARKNLSYGSIWVRSSERSRGASSQHMTLIAAIPRARVHVDILPASHPCMAVLNDERFRIVRDNEPGFDAQIVEDGIEAGSFISYKLGDVGVLRLHSNRADSFVLREINQLFSVIETFTISINGALAEMRFKQEAEERREVESRLQQAERLKMLGQLTGGIAHDFNNLLAVIQGSAEFLEMMPDHDEEMVQSILGAAKRGSALTHRLLAYARRQPLKSEAVDLAALVDGMMTILDRSIGNNVEIIWEPPGGLWLATADPRQVEDALLNLSINARDAMPDGGYLTISLRNTPIDADFASGYPDFEPGDYVTLTVSDTGTGMPREVQERIFEPFFTTKELGSGSGLGLSTVYGFAKQSGGHLSVYSEVGIGTTFVLYLPRNVGGQVTTTDASEGDVILGSGERILVLEDDPAVRNLCLKMLDALNYKTLAAGDAAEARGLLASGAQFDLILSDVVLPGGVSGPQFVAEIGPRYPDLRVVFMSGFPPEAAMRSGLTDPATILLNKPFRRKVLARALHDALHRPSGSGTGEHSADAVACDQTAKT